MEKQIEIESEHKLFTMIMPRELDKKIGDFALKAGYSYNEKYSKADVIRNAVVEFFKNQGV